MKGMSLIARTITRLTLGLILLFGFYVMFHGHVSHGVGFAGGVIIALGFIHLMLAYGREVANKHISETSGLLMQNIGLLVFLVLSVAGMALGGKFMSNFVPVSETQQYHLYSSGIILLYNLTVCLAVAGCLYMVFLSLVDFEHKKG
jgi:multicomponent Na+:H+ antiporter subunit B